MSLPPPPKMPKQSANLSFTMAARYVRTHHHWANITRQTIHNWAKHGVAGERLKYERAGFMYQTRKEWVDDFLARIPKR